MSKIFAFIVTFPLVFVLFVKAVAFYDYDTKERYLQNAADLLAYKVKITGVLTDADIADFLPKVQGLLNCPYGDITCWGWTGTDSAGGGSVTWSGYTPGARIPRGQYFKLYVQGSVSFYSKVQNFGVDVSDPGNNLKYRAKSVVRVEYYDG